jgi:Galactose oxidase-like, Early set domain/PKD domain
MREASAERTAVRPWAIAAALFVVVALAGLDVQDLVAQASVQGQWRTLPLLMPINPVHLAVTHDGNVLIVSGSGNVATETNFRAGVWDLQANTIATRSLGWDMFCNGMVVLPDGRAFINGGNLQYDPFHGEPRNTAFDPVLGTFTDLENMAHGRWYPTVTTLGDGRVMTFSGLNETGGTNTAVEIYTVGSGWSAEYPAGWTPPLYPRMHLMTDGRVFYSGSGTGSRIFNPSTHAWSAVVANTNYGGSRTYGTSVLLPLTPANGYTPRVMIMGGGNPATATTEIIDLSAPTPQWQFGPSMSQPRIEMNATILPNGKVLALGGSTNDEDAATASLNADLYDPSTNTFRSAGANAYPRLYHSGSLLLPDATVMVAGGNPTRGSYEQHIEIYSPPYLFNTDGSLATRPAITSVTPGAFSYGGAFQVFTPAAATIASVVLMRPGAQTHAFDMDQRMVGLSFTAGSGVLNVTAPPNGNIAPPGYYMLFAVTSAGVPSIASFVQLTNAPPNQAPTATITSPASNVTVNAGQSVPFAGTGSDPDGTITGYSWSFPGGTPAASSVASPGNVTYSTPGTYVASFTVTDNGGLTSPAATRTITVPDFSLSAMPASQAVLPGDSTSYTATVTAGAGFTGTVSFSVSGLPQGATASFNPGSVASSGSTAMSVSTSGTTPAGSYTLTIAATSGVLTHTANVTLVVNGDFSIATTPASRTISRGGSATYTVTIAAGPGFAGAVNLSVTGLPKFANGKFNPLSVTGSGTSVLTVSTNRNVTIGNYTLTITGTSGSRVHTSSVTMIVQ